MDFIIFFSFGLKVGQVAAYITAVTLWKCSIVIAHMMKSIMFLLKYYSVENKFFQWPF